MGYTNVSAVIDFQLPELGENVSGGDVLKVLVKPGDTIAVDQPVLELETDKATIEVPSSVAGRVGDVRIKEGQKVKVGDVVLTVEGEGQAAKASAPVAAPGPAEAEAQPERPAASPKGAAKPVESSSPRVNEPPEDQTEKPAEAPPRQESKPAAASGPVEFKLPSLGENIVGGDVLRVLVREGDTVQGDQGLLELETDKATIEVPSSLAGRILEVRIKEGQKVKVGDVAFIVEPTGDAAQATGAITVQRVHAAAAPAEPAGAEAAAAGSERARAEDVVPEGGLQQHVPGAIRSSGQDKAGVLEEASDESQPRAPSPRGAVVAMPTRDDVPRKTVPAAPSVRRMARELGVDISQVTGSGPGGRISTDDIKAFVKRVMSSGGPRLASTDIAATAGAALPDFAKWGEIDRKPMKPVRRATAEHVSRAWTMVPHVTQCDKADVTQIEALRERYGRRVEEAGGKFTVTAVAMKVVAAALQKFPQFNSSADVAAKEIVFKKYVHIGIAVDTERGLLVPVIRDVDKKGIVDVAVEIAKAAERARSGKTSLEEMQGGCFTITNLGSIGGTYFTPIVNYPEVAILGMSRARMEPVWKDDKFEPRMMLPLSLSYDHRVIDGADGIKFLRWVVEALEEPFLLSLLG